MCANMLRSDSGATGGQNKLLDVAKTLGLPLAKMFFVDDAGGKDTSTGEGLPKTDDDAVDFEFDEDETTCLPPVSLYFSSHRRATSCTPSSPSSVQQQGKHSYSSLGLVVESPAVPP